MEIATTLASVPAMLVSVANGVRSVLSTITDTTIADTLTVKKVCSL